MSTAIPEPLPPRYVPSLAERFRRLYARRETVRFLVHSNLKADHRDKFLGRVWSLLDPLLFMLVYLVVFGFLFGQARRGPAGTTEFIIYLLCGVMSWRFFEGAVSQAAGCIRTHRGLIHEISFPKAVFPVSVCLSRLSDFLWGLLVLFGFVLVVSPHYFTPQIAWFPLIVLLQVMFTLGLAFVTAYLGAFFADTANIVSVTMRFWFYCSPLFYHVKKSERGLIPDRYVPLYMLNPIASFFESYRDCLLRGRMPDPQYLAYLAGVSIVALVAGFWLFSRGEGHFAKYV